MTTRAILPLTITLTLLVLCFLLHAAVNDAKDRAVSIRLTPVVVMAGGNFWLTCRVERDPRNRVLDYGVVNLREHSQRQLDGESAPITFPPVLVEHVPCGSGPAYCAVIRNDGSQELAEQPFMVGGCDPIADYPGQK